MSPADLPIEQVLGESVCILTASNLSENVTTVCTQILLF